MSTLAPPKATSRVPSSPMRTAVRSSTKSLPPCSTTLPRMVRLEAGPSSVGLALATPTRSRLLRPMSTPTPYRPLPWSTGVATLPVMRNCSLAAMPLSATTTPKRS